MYVYTYIYIYYMYINVYIYIYTHMLYTGSGWIPWMPAKPLVSFL